MFAAVLGVPGVADDADFLALGGTSLALGVVCTRLSAALDRPVPISEAVRRTTARELAAWLAARGGTDDEPAPDAGGEALVLSPMQRSFWLRQSLEPDDISGLCPFAWRLDGPFDEAALAAALGDVADRHEALRSVYVARETGGRVEAVAEPYPPRGEALPVERIADAATEDDAWTALRDALSRPIDVGTGPVWRAAVVPVGGTATTLLGVVVHHIAFDGGSEEILVEDLAASYAARARGEAPVFERPAPTLREAADLLRHRARQADLPAQRDYWKRALDGIPELDLGPAAEPDDGAGRGYRALGAQGRSRTLGFDLGPDDAAAVARLAAEHATTPFVVLLSACAAAVGQVTGQSDFGIGVAVSRRAGAALDSMVGCFVDTVCLRMRPAPGDDRRPLIEDVRRTALDGLAAQDVPFAEVVELVDPPRTGRDPLYQVIFAYQDNPSPALRLSGTVGHPVRLPAMQGLCEVAIEVWPCPSGTYSVCVTYQTESVGERFGTAVRDAFTGALAPRPREGD